MFGRKARRIAELERQVDFFDELVTENGALEAENEQLNSVVLSLRQRLAAVAAAELRPYVVWDPRTEPRHGLTAGEWNAQFPIGTAVRAWPGGREQASLNTVTRTPAWTLGDGTPVVSVEGETGGIGLDFVDLVHDSWRSVEPTSVPRPAPGEAELTDTEAHVVPCPKCSQPHGDGGVCGTDIKEAA